MTHSIHLHFNLFSFPSPVFPLYFSLSSLCLSCAFSQKHLLLHYFSLFVSKFSEAHPPCSFLCYIILSLLFSVPFAPAVASLLFPLLPAIISPGFTPSYIQSFPPAKGPHSFGAVLPVCSKETLLQPLSGCPPPPFFSQCPLLKAVDDTSCCRYLLLPLWQLSYLRGG